MASPRLVVSHLVGGSDDRVDEAPRFFRIGELSREVMDAAAVLDVDAGPESRQDCVDGIDNHDDTYKAEDL